MIFNCQIVEERDEHGTLHAIGARWTEARTFVEFILEKLVDVAMFVAFICIYGVGLFASEIGWGLALALAMAMVGIVYSMMRAVVHCAGRTRELTFWRDGVVRAPFGLAAAWFENGESRLPHTDIKSIEVEQVSEPDKNRAVNYSHGVRIFYRTGHVVHIARYIEPDDAHRLAVGLTNALRELRASMAHEGRTARSRAVRRHPRGQSEPALID